MILREVGFWVTAAISVPFFILAYIAGSIWLGLEVGWLSVKHVMAKQ